MTPTTAAGYRLPDTTDATLRIEWHLTPTVRVKPYQIREYVITDPDKLDEALVEWREDFAAPALWQRAVLEWPDGARFVEAWTLADDEG